MSTAIIACRTLEAELSAAMARCRCDYPVVWLNSGLHNVPVCLRQAVQEAIDGCSGCDTILLAMGFCGNSVCGVRSRSARLVLPRVDDCITLLLGSAKKRGELVGSYFFTEGWLRGERTIWWEYQHALKRYGPKKTEMIFRTMLQNYRQIVMVDTGCYDPEPVYAEVKRMAQVFGLEPGAVQGTLEGLLRLLTGPWPEEQFVHIPPHSEITQELLQIREDAICAK